MTSKAGIYKIVNLVNNKIYVGSSVNLPSRKYEHFKKLSNNVHHNAHLQNSYNKYSKENFVFQVVEYINIIEDRQELKNILLEREQYYINTLQPQYNIRPIAVSCAGCKKSKDTCKKIVVSRKNNNKEWHTQETKEKIRNANKGHEVTQETKEKIKQYRIGKKQTQETKEKIKNTLKNRPAKNRKKVINITTNKIFDSITQASKFYNISDKYIIQVCKGVRKHAGGYFWKYYQ